MLPALTNLFSIFGDNVKKTNVQTEVESTYTMLNDTVIPSIELTLEKMKDIDISKDLSKSLTLLGRSMGLKGKSTLDGLVKELLSFSKEISDSKDMLEDIIDKDLPDYMTDRSMTSRTAAITGTVANFNSIVMFLMDINLFLLYKASEDNMYYKAKAISIQNMFPPFGLNYKRYRKAVKKTLSGISGLSDTEISDKDTFHMSASKNDANFNLPNNGFIGNPIYYVRLWMVEMDINKLEVLNDKKKLVELKLIDLKLSQTGKPDPKIQKQIEYYEDKIANLEYKINKLEG